MNNPRNPRTTPNMEIPEFLGSPEFRDLFRRIIKILSFMAIPILLFLYWWFHPPINIHSEGTWNFILVVMAVPLLVILRVRSVLVRTESPTRPSGPKEVDEKGRIRAKAVSSPNQRSAESRSLLYKRLSYLPLAVFAFFLVGLLLSSTFFPGNARRYSSIMTIETRDFTNDIHEINYSEVPVIDRDSAALLGNRVMGEIPEYVSQFDISPIYSQINYRGRPVRVSPIGYADIIKWFNNRTNGLPAYIFVDSASQDARIVRLDAPMLYSESEPLFRNIHRYVQLQYPFYIFDQKSFEIDDDGNPWWVCPVQTRRIGLFGGKDITRIVLCNASTGECIDLPIDECPQWVDRAYPADLVIEQYNWYGAYQKGWLNSWLGQESVVQTTPGTDGQLGYNYLAQDDDIWVYSGITSATSDNSIVGFVLINQRTAEARFFQISGATEVSAMHSAEGQVQQMRYRSTFPLLVNVNGQPTYFMALKDDAGLVKMFAMLDIQRYQNVAVGETVEACQAEYQNLLLKNGVIDESTELKPGSDLTASGTVTRISTAVIDGNSHFYLSLADDPNIYDCALPDLMAVLQVQPGDTVLLTYREDGQVRTVEKIEFLETP
ncbi:MAG: Tat pathway signal sequence [Coriobacteriia bacterium]|nr:Tat pathway signal sequence [Coriobacteriia bacterium]